MTDLPKRGGGGMGDFEKQGDPSNGGMILKWGRGSIPYYGLWKYLFFLVCCGQFSSGVPGFV